MTVHHVNHTFNSLSLAGHAVNDDEFYIGKPVASLCVRGVPEGWWGDSPEDLEGVEKAMRAAQRTCRGEDDVRQMQPHVVYSFTDYKRARGW